MDSVGGETTPSFGHPPMLGGAKTPRPSDTPPMLGGGEAALPFFCCRRQQKEGLLSKFPKSLLIGGKGGCIPPNRREGRCTPTRSTQCKGHALIINNQIMIFDFL